MSLHTSTWQKVLFVCLFYLLLCPQEYCRCGMAEELGVSCVTSRALGLCCAYFLQRHRAGPRLQLLFPSPLTEAEFGLWLAMNVVLVKLEKKYAFYYY